MSKQTRRRQLEQQRTKRDSERVAVHRRRARVLAVVLGAVGIAVVGVIITLTRITGEPTSPAGTAGAPVSPDNALADVPDAPATVACDGEVPPSRAHPTFPDPPAVDVRADATYEVDVATSCGTFTIRLDQEAAPQTVSSFLFLARQGFYDSTWFHRVVNPDAGGIGVVQGGDPQGTGQGGPGYELPDELPEAANPYQRYTVAMANAGPGTSGSQFFVNTQDNSGLPPSYSQFGEVTEGREVIDRISGVPLGGPSGDTPQEAVWVESITVRES